MPVQNEYAPLSQVIIHEPGYEWNLVTVEDDMPEKFLIEDVLFTDRAAHDHREFTNCLRWMVGDDGVIEFAELLKDILTDREVRSDVVGAVSALERVGVRTHDSLLSNDLPLDVLVQLLIAGAYKPEDPDHRGYTVLFPPAPNLLFTRDIGMIVGQSFILAHPAKAIRRREALLARYIFCNHPLFTDYAIVDVLDDATSHGLTGSISLEGGDINLIDDETLLIGTGERSSPTAAMLLARRLIADGTVKRVIQVEMPSDRATMHLDTVFTIIGPHDCVYYPPFFSEADDSHPIPCTVFESVGGSVQATYTSGDRGLFTTLETLGYSFRNRIPCGGDIPHYQTREQWTDGANMFALSPQITFIYERNIHTIDAFAKAGYEIIRPEEVVKRDPSTASHLLVTLSGAELSRGRGGARCMTMPITRQH